MGVSRIIRLSDADPTLLLFTLAISRPTPFLFFYFFLLATQRISQIFETAHVNVTHARAKIITPKDEFSQLLVSPNLRE